MKVLTLDEYLNKRIRSAKQSLFLAIAFVVLGGVVTWHLFFSPFNPQSLEKQQNKILAKRCEMQAHFETIKPTTDLERQLIEQVKSGGDAFAYSISGSFNMALYIMFLMAVGFPLWMSGVSVGLLYTLTKIKKLKELQS